MHVDSAIRASFQPEKKRLNFDLFQGEAVSVFTDVFSLYYQNKHKIPRSLAHLDFSSFLLPSLLPGCILDLFLLLLIINKRRRRNNQLTLVRLLLRPFFLHWLLGTLLLHWFFLHKRLLLWLKLFIWRDFFNLRFFISATAENHGHDCRGEGGGENRNPKSTQLACTLSSLKDAPSPPMIKAEKTNMPKPASGPHFRSGLRTWGVNNAENMKQRYQLCCLNINEVLKSIKVNKVWRNGYFGAKNVEATQNISSYESRGRREKGEKKNKKNKKTCDEKVWIIARNCWQKHANLSGVGWFSAPLGSRKGLVVIDPYIGYTWGFMVKNCSRKWPCFMTFPVVSTYIIHYHVLYVFALKIMLKNLTPKIYCKYVLYMTCIYHMLDFENPLSRSLSAGVVPPSSLTYSSLMVNVGEEYSFKLPFEKIRFPLPPQKR